MSRNTDRPPAVVLPGAPPAASFVPSAAPSGGARGTPVTSPVLPPHTAAGGPRGVTVGVMGGRGGAGASVLAAALAREAVLRRRPSALVDADPLGGGADALLGAEQATGLRWPELTTVRGRLPAGSLLSALPVVDGLPVVSWDRETPVDLPPDAIAAVIESLARDVDLVVLDLARGGDPAAHAALDRCDVVLLVVPAEVRAAWAAGRCAEVLRARVADLRLVVRGPSPGGLRGAAIAENLGLPLAGELRPEPGLAAALERGEPPGLRRRGPLATFCRRLLADLPARASR